MQCSAMLCYAIYPSIHPSIHPSTRRMCCFPCLLPLCPATGPVSICVAGHAGQNQSVFRRAGLRCCDPDPETFIPPPPPAAANRTIKLDYSTACAERQKRSLRAASQMASSTHVIGKSSPAGQTFLEKRREEPLVGAYFGVRALPSAPAPAPARPRREWIENCPAPSRHDQE